MMKRFVSGGWMLGVATLAALVQGLVLDWPEAVSAEDAAFGLSIAQVAQVPAILWVDGRPQEAFAKGHIAGAVSLNFDNWEAGFAGLLEVWQGAETILVYCDDEACGASRDIAARLRNELGEPVYWLVEGWRGLVAEGWTP